MLWPTTRREFIRRLVIAPAAMAWIAQVANAAGSARRVRLGLIADVHQDVMPDGVERVRAFVAAMKQAKPDFILQLGDFCQSHPRNQPFLDAWNAFPGTRYHVLGNHDMDGGATREQTVAFYGMPEKHYAFTAGPVRGIVLDGNEPGGTAKGYKRFIGTDQLAWLERELAQTDRPVVIFIHQPLDDEGTGYVENAGAVRTVLEHAASKIIAVFSGHRHMDYERVVNGVRHIQINSASYVWLPGPAARESYPPEVHKAHPYLRNVAAYREPLWALVTIDLERGELVIKGKRSVWVGPNPWQRGAPETEYPRDATHPFIADRQAKLSVS